MHGFGRVGIEADEPIFHADWEGRVLALNSLLLTRRLYTIDAFRHGIETLAPIDYLQASYYERWRRSVEKQLMQSDWLDARELEERLGALRRSEEAPPGRPAPPVGRSRVGALESGVRREVAAWPRFREGQTVRARNQHPRGHTRLPRYARGRAGRIAKVGFAYVFPDANAHGQGESPQYLYSVRFEGRELWGDSAEEPSAVYLDLFEPYLEAAELEAAELEAAEAR